MQTKIKKIEAEAMKKDIAGFRVGDTVAVYLSIREEKRKSIREKKRKSIREEKRKRAQIFEGVVLRRRGGKTRETFTVRKTSFGIGVERVFPLHSPLIEKIEVIKRGRVRRANLSYLRGKTKR